MVWGIYCMVRALIRDRVGVVCGVGFKLSEGVRR